MASKQQVSDLSLNLAAFHPESTPESTLDLNNTIIQKCKEDKKWWTVGASSYRELRAAGKTAFPLAPRLDKLATDFTIPSARTEVAIPCRGFFGDGTPPAGIFYHIHGGGYVLGSAASQDLMLHEIQQKTNLAVISIDYRLAPEHPWPAALDDCIDVAEWLLENSQSQYNSPVRFIGGESAGATLGALVMQHIRDQRANHDITGLVLSYGCFDLALLPSVRMLDPGRPLVLSYEDVEQFTHAYLPNHSVEERRHPHISPLYADLTGLGSALFIVGTVDGLLDDSLLASAKWAIAGNEAILKFVPGAAHGFMTFDGTKVSSTKMGWGIMIDYILSKCN